MLAHDPPFGFQLLFITRDRILDGFDPQRTVRFSFEQLLRNRLEPYVKLLQMGFEFGDEVHLSLMLPFRFDLEQLHFMRTQAKVGQLDLAVEVVPLGCIHFLGRRAL